MAGVQLTDAWGAMPEYDFRPTPNGVMYITAKRWGDYVWIRSNHTILPNFGHTAALWEDGDAERLFTRASVSRWVVPIDDTHTVVLGVRHFNSSVDPKGRGNEAEVGEDAIDFMGQTGNRPYAERQRDPGDWDARFHSARLRCMRSSIGVGPTKVWSCCAARYAIGSGGSHEARIPILTSPPTAARSGPTPTIRSFGCPERRTTTIAGAGASWRPGSPTSSPDSTSSRSPSGRSESKESWQDCRRAHDFD